MRSSTLVALATSFASALAQSQYQGFNYGSAAPNGAPYTQQDFEAQFKTAASLVGTSGAFTSARLFTMVQAGTQNTVISAIPAALSTKTKLLLGLWASGGDAGFANELQALKTAIQQFPQLSSQLVGISVGSEDLYRISPAAAAAGSINPGAQPSTLVNYVSQVRDAIKGTAWSSAQIGHVDTWTAFANGSNDALSAALDFVGVDAYPYFQTADDNVVENGAALFQAAINGLTATAKSKQIWITETGWPVKGNTLNKGVPGTAQAKKYWDAVGCGLLFGKYSHVFWYTLQDEGAPDPNFGVVPAQLTTTPLYDLSCPAGGSSSSSSASSSTASQTGSGSGSSNTNSASNTASATASASASASSATATAAGTGSQAQTGGPSTVVIQTVSATGGAIQTGTGSGAATTVVTANGTAPTSSAPTSAAATSLARNPGNAASGLDTAGSALLAIIAGGAALVL